MDSLFDIEATSARRLIMRKQLSSTQENPQTSAPAHASPGLATVASMTAMGSYGYADGVVQRKTAVTSAAAPGLHAAEAGGGEDAAAGDNRTGLPDHLKTGIEALSGVSLDRVNVHYNSAEPARVDAHAYAQGSHIHLAQGQERHLPHEAWHLVQQAQGRVAPALYSRGVPVNDDPVLEQEADRMGEAALRLPGDNVRSGSLPAQAGHRPFGELAQTVAPPPGLHYTMRAVQRSPVAAATMSAVVQRVTKKRPRSDAFSPDDSQEDELEAASTSASHDYIGLASWNVQHFSDHDLKGMAQTLSEQLAVFKADQWKALFEDFSEFGDGLEMVFDEGYAADMFKGLQSPKSRFDSMRAHLKAYKSFLKDFEVEDFADQIEAFKEKDWKAEIEQSNNERDSRVALAEIAGQFKSVTKLIDEANASLKKMRLILDELKLIERMGLGEIGDYLDKELKEVSNGIVNKSTLEAFRKALHSHNITVHIDEMFAQNEDWLDMIILQEINNPDLLEKGDHGYSVHRGQHLKSAGQNGQNEYYPLLIRNDSGVEFVTAYRVTTAGKLENISDDKSYIWNKRKSVYRPIVVYLVTKQTSSGKQPYLIGVVHTTPEVDGGLAEFNRRAIYDEVRKGLETLKKLAEDANLPLIVGGDYYLSAEAVVKEPTSKDLSMLKGSYDSSNEDEDIGHYLDEDDLDKDDLADVEKTKLDIDHLIKTLERKIPVLKEEQEEEDELIEIVAPEVSAQEEEKRALIKEINERLKILHAAKGDAQIIRNIRGLTTKAQVEQLGLRLDQTVSGTNPKANPLLRWFDLQIADFFIYNDVIKESRVGVMRPEGDMVPLDREDLHYSRYWQHFSDHFPVGGIYGVGEQAIPSHLGRARQYSQKAMELARESNLRRFARLALIQTGKKPDLDALPQTDIKALALEWLRARIETIDPRAVATDDVEECIALIQQLEGTSANLIAEDKRLFVTEPGDFEPDYDAGGMPTSTDSPPPTKKRRFEKEASRAGARSNSSSNASLQKPASSLGETGMGSHEQGGWKGESSMDTAEAWDASPPIHPPASANRVSQPALQVFLNNIAPGWNQSFQNLQGTAAPQGLNQGYMAHEIAREYQALAMPVFISEDAEQQRIAGHQLRILSNSGRRALCFIYSILMGLTGQSERDVAQMVAYVAGQAGLTGGWINADSQDAANVVDVINGLYGVDLDVVVVQHGTDVVQGATQAVIIISGRAGRVGGDTVVIRQTPGHYDAYIS